MLDRNYPLKHNINMNRLDPEKRAQAIAALVEGNSIRAIARMTGITRNTITSLLADLGAACAEYQDRALRNLRCQPDSVRRNLGFLLREGQEYPRRQAGSVRHWKRLDLDGLGCRHKTHRFVGRRTARRGCGKPVHDGSLGSRQQSHPVDEDG